MILVYNMNVMEADACGKLMNILNRFGEPWRQLGKGDLDVVVADLLLDGQGQLNIGPEDAPDVPFLLMDMPEANVDELLAVLREEKVKLPYKAMLTEYNKQWLFSDLVKHVIAEDRQVRAVMQLERLLQAASMFPEESYEAELWQQHAESRRAAEAFMARFKAQEEVTADEAEAVLKRFNDSVLVLMGKEPEA